MNFILILLYDFPYSVRRSGVVCRIPAFQPGGLSSIPDGIRDFNLYPRTGCVLSCVVSDGGPDILLVTDSERPDLLLLYSVLALPTGGISRLGSASTSS